MNIQIEIKEINSNDVAQFLHCNKRTAQRRLELLRLAYNLPKRAIITLDLFCEYYCIREQDIRIKYYR